MPSKRSWWYLPGVAVVPYALLFQLLAGYALLLPAHDRELLRTCIALAVVWSLSAGVGFLWCLPLDGFLRFVATILYIPFGGYSLMLLAERLVGAFLL